MTQSSWIDIHCHILPGVDDGSQSMEESIEMAREAEKGGTGFIAGSFHAGVDLYDAVIYRPLVEKLNATFKERGIDVTVMPSSEVMAGFLPDNLTDFSINGSRYLLVEFPSSHIPQAAASILRAYKERGLTTIIAHPERNPTILRDPNRLFQLLAETGALTQITADSIAGTFGRDIEGCARYLLKRGAVDIIASDAHDTDYRTTNMADGVKAAAKVVGEVEALKMVRETPLSVINDEVVVPKGVCLLQSAW